jgi:hypothetical protein
MPLGGQNEKYSHSKYRQPESDLVPRGSGNPTIKPEKVGSRRGNLARSRTPRSSVGYYGSIPGGRRNYLDHWCDHDIRYVET